MQPNQAPTAQSALSRPAARPPLGGFAAAALVGATGVIALSIILFGTDERSVLGLGVALCVFLIAAGIASLSMLRTYPHASLGLCNLVTLLRLVIVATLAGALLSGVGPSWAVFMLAAIALTLDGVDGWLARRQHLASSFGARFDVEVDAAFALVLTLHALIGGSAGLIVVLLGLPYYLFAAANRLFPWLSKPLPEKFSRKAMCVIQIGLLVALQLPFLAPDSLDPLIAFVALALTLSFGRDIIWLWRTRS